MIFFQKIFEKEEMKWTTIFPTRWIWINPMDESDCLVGYFRFTVWMWIFSKFNWSWNTSVQRFGVQPNVNKRKISLEAQLAIILLRLRQGITFRLLAWIFRIPLSSHDTYSQILDLLFQTSSTFQVSWRNEKKRAFIPWISSFSHHWWNRSRTTNSRT